MRAARGRSGGQVPRHPQVAVPDARAGDVPPPEDGKDDERLPMPSSPRTTLVIPALTLPSIATPRAGAAYAGPHGAPHRRTGTPAPMPRQTADWLNDVDPQHRAAHTDTQHWTPNWDETDESESERPYGPDGDGARASAHNRSRRARTAVADIADENELPDLDRFELPPPVAPVSPSTHAPRPVSHRRHLAQQERLPASATRGGRGRGISRRIADIVVIPTAQRAAPRPMRRTSRQVAGAVARALGAVARRPMLVSALVLVVTLLAALANVTGAAQQAGVLSASAWHALSNSASAQNVADSGQDVAPPVYDAQHYMEKYGFFQPGASSAIPSDEMARLATMLPFAIKATSAYNKRYGQSVEPQLLLYWTYSEGIGARINYSDCANEPGPSYFTYIANCDHASFWQLGYGNQFGVIYVLRNAFTDLYGDPNDAQLVAKVGQSVLDYDAAQGTTPPCGGYTCTFPAMTIDDILTGVDLTTGVKEQDNWWASVLSRDPMINCYMIAHALTFFNHDATKNWIGCYYTTPCWQRDSDKLGDILAAWPALLKAARIQG